MHIKRFLGNAAVIAFGWSLLGCASGPRALETTMPERSLMSVPPSERGVVLDALRDEQIARMEFDNASYRLDEIATEIDIARNEHDKAELDKDSAKMKGKVADKSRDTDRIVAASEGTTLAESGHEVAERKIAYLEAEQTYLESVVEWRQYDLRAKSAAVELAKASVARDNNLPIRGFDYAAYEQQHKEALVEAARFKKKAERAAEMARAKRAHWQTMATR